MIETVSVPPPVPQTDTNKQFGKYTIVVAVMAILVLGVVFLSPAILTKAGEWLIMDSPPSQGDAVVVLTTGTEYYPRLMEAARIYQNGFSKRIVINGNRKTAVIRKLEDLGFSPACHWCEDYLRILSLFDVPQDTVQCISAEDAYDTVSEAEFVGNRLILQGYTKLIITTSKFHSKRAYHIWKDLFPQQLEISVVSAKEDPFEPDSWWKSGRQVRWVMAEYGAWIYYYWKKTTTPPD